MVNQNETKRVLYPMQGSLVARTRSNVVRAGVRSETDREKCKSEGDRERGEDGGEGTDGGHREPK